MNCDPIAPWYAALEYASFGSLLLQTRCRYLNHCRAARRVLLLGEGDGRFLQRLVRINPTATFDYVDVSEGMLEVARRRCRTERVRFHRLDVVVDDLPSRNYDLIVTHFFLDCLSDQQLQQLITKLSANTTDAQWLISEFAIPADGWRRLRALVWVRFLYEAFGTLTGLRVRQLPAYATALANANFQCVRSHTSSAGLLKSELWQTTGRSYPTLVDATQFEVVK